MHSSLGNRSNGTRIDYIQVRERLIGEIHIFTKHPIVMWPRKTQPYFVCYYIPCIGCNRCHLASGVVDMWSLEVVKSTKGTRVDCIQA